EKPSSREGNGRTDVVQIETLRNPRRTRTDDDKASVIQNDDDDQTVRTAIDDQRPPTLRPPHHQFVGGRMVVVRSTPTTCDRSSCVINRQPHTFINRFKESSHLNFPKRVIISVKERQSTR
ncbi:hypothetical protein U1Q18_037453, partial [Sarracenia purpurea var. burkii]